MHVDLFYQVGQDSRAIPVYLVSQILWDEGLDLNTMERNCFAVRQFKGKLGDWCFIHNADGLIEKAYIGSGMNQQETALAYAAALLPAGLYQLNDIVSMNALVHWALAQYRFTDYKKTEVQPRQLVIKDEDVNHVIALAQSIFLVRDLINKPACDMGPKELGAVVEQLARSHRAVFTQWVGDELLSNNFPAIHAVGRAATAAPRLLSLTWGDERNPRVTLVGKGVCFDSGGLDIKQSSGMRLMKKDMGGAAHVIGLAQWIMMQGLPIRLQVLIPAVENAIGPESFRPGDVLTMRNGLTVEIDNTDAEGRLVLADALVKACEEKPELIIDFATLTGAARVAVGTEIATLFTNNNGIAAELADAALKTADPIWRLPLHAGYEDMLNSSIADLANSASSSYAGAITAGLFLQRFIAANTAWVHFDVMAWNLGNKPGKPEGGEAMALKAVAEYLLRTYG